MSSWYFTAPWEPIAIRRGDALGFRAAADYFADLVAPGLSNGTSDARWISLLSWCLKWSHVAWRSGGGHALVSREEQRRRYAWLRPLELLWIGRALESGQHTGQLRGRRSVGRWLQARREGRPLANFGMSDDQFRRYRQTGSYGAYRVLFRSIPSLTSDGGWTPGPTALELAALVNESLPPAARLDESHFERGIKWSRWNANEARFWVDRWQGALQERGGHLPLKRDRWRAPLTAPERAQLKPLLFGKSSVRSASARALAGATSARSHLDLCRALAGSAELARLLPPAALEPLPAFSQLADEAMRAMRRLWHAVNRDASKESPPLDRIARNLELREALDSVRRASTLWPQAPGRSTFPHNEAVTDFAKAMADAGSPLDQLRTLIKHHGEQGGGRRWFQERGANLSPLVGDTGIASSDYRFRLGALCRLAAQCDVADMNTALGAIERHGDHDEGLEDES